MEKRLITKFFSRKLFASVFSMLLIILAVSQAAYSKLSDSVLMVTIPSVIICITVICVTYVSGVAKIDINASIQGPQ